MVESRIYWIHTHPLYRHCIVRQYSKLACKQWPSSWHAKLITWPQIGCRLVSLAKRHKKLSKKNQTNLKTKDNQKRRSENGSVQTVLKTYLYLRPCSTLRYTSSCFCLKYILRQLWFLFFLKHSPIRQAMLGVQEKKDIWQRLLPAFKNRSL